MYAYHVDWTPALQPPGVVAVGYRVAFKRCDSEFAPTLVDVGLVTSYTVDLPLDRYCWTVATRSASAVSAPSPTLVFHSSPDTDGDSIVDDQDNCELLANPGQVDSDGDGFGNRCDGDLNGNGATNSQDFVLFQQALGQPSTPPTYHPADFNANGFVNSQDYVIFQQLLGLPPGP